MPLFLLLSAQLSLPVISRKIITPPDHTYGTVSVRNIYWNMCRGRTGHKSRAWLAPCQPRRGALVPPGSAGVVRVSPWWCHHCDVPVVVSPSWWGDSGLIVLRGFGLCGILCFVGNRESPPAPSPSPALFPKGVPKPGGHLRCGGVQSPSW